MMSGTPGMRIALAIMSPIFLVLCVVAIRSEETRPWMRYQEEFNALYLDRAAVKLSEAEARNDATDRARWQRVIDELSHAKPEIAQVYLEDLKVADRCVTCHRGIDNPLFQDATEPFRSHPGKLLKQHDMNAFGCTPCHQGQGLATTVDGAHGREANWQAPLWPAAYVQASCGRCHEVIHGVAGAELVSRGADLFMETGCYGCHDVKGISYLPKFAPPMSVLKSKLVDPHSWVYSWIKDPAHFNPDTMMPNFRLRDDETGKITAFLMSLSEEGHRCEEVALDGASADEGERLFKERGCRGCHAVEADEHSASRRVPHLAGIGSKAKAEWINHSIQDPRAHNPDTAMPKVELKDDERRALVAYLITLKRDEPLPAAPDLGGFDANEGKELVKQYECFGCHVIKGFEQVRPAVPDLGEFARRPVDELDFATTTDVPRTKWDWLRRKLKDPRAYETDKIKLRMPEQKLTDEETDALVAYMLGLDAPTLPARYAVRASQAQRAVREVAWMTARFNCGACHRLRDEDPRIARFFDLKNMTPPTLKGVGARLQGEYMYQFLLEPKQVRPWLKLRMPTFGFTEDQARVIVEGFAGMELVTNPYTYVVKAEVAPDHFQRGVRRFRHYKCVQCHPTSIDEGLPEDVDPEDLSINLMLTKARLRPEWIKDFMARPKQIAGTQTRMPTAFYTVDGVPKVEHPRKDIDDITTYLMAMVEEPEVTLQALEAEQQQIEEERHSVDWSTVDY